MPLHYQLDQSMRCVLAIASEPFLDEDLIQYLEALAADPDHGSGYDQLIDLRGVGVRGVTTEGVRAVGNMSDRFEAHVRGTRCALVVASLEAFGMGRMFEAMASRSVSVSVFMLMEDAEEWLDSDRVA